MHFGWNKYTIKSLYVAFREGMNIDHQLNYKCTIAIQEQQDW